MFRPSGLVRSTLTSYGAEQISEERHGNCPGQGKLELPAQGGRRDESFNQAGKKQDGDDAYQQANGFSSGLGQGVATGEKTREQQALGKAQASASCDENGRQLQHAVRSHKAPKGKAH